MMVRRHVVAVALVLGLLAAPFAVRAQPGRIPRIGVMLGASRDESRPYSEAFRQGLQELGYVEDRSVAIELRFLEGRLDRSFDLASELVRLPVNVIVAPGTAAAQATRRVTTTIPIVMVTAGNPVGDGLITSFARPGGNVTGLTMAVDAGIGGKLLELLKAAVPKISRVAILWDPLTAPHVGMVKETEAAARTLGVTLRPVSARRPEELDSAFGEMSGAHANGLIVLADAMFLASRERIAELAMKGRLPAIYGIGEHAEAGGLMSYSPSLPDLFRRAATYVDRILKGAKPSELPVERPSKFYLIVNLKAAHGLGLTIPPSLLARADRVIE